MRENTSDYRALFLENAFMADLRAPVEFEKGAFEGAVNLPLMNDSERKRVGTCFKYSGQEAAIALGHRLVSGKSRSERIAAWVAFTHANPNGYLYCFRGGLRSQTVQEWLKVEAGIDYPRVFGGYKAMRAFLINTIEQAVAECRFVVLGGMTGTGKTDVLRPLPNKIDIEAHAHHRGSSFGRHAGAQPTQINFENRMAVDVLKKRAAGHDVLVLEDESRAIGSCNLPLALYQRMQNCPMIWLDDSLENRIHRIVRDYVVDLRAEFVAMYGEEQGFILFSERLAQSLDKLVKRLGGERHQRLAVLMRAALAEQERTGNVELHRGWIAGLLTEYYDPMYTYQRELKSSRIAFAGNQQAILDYMLTLSNDDFAEVRGAS